MIAKLSMFTLAISCLTTSNSPWFMDLTFQVPMQYCSLLSPPDISTTGLRFWFGSASSFLLELFFYSSPVAYWTPTDPGGLSFTVFSYFFPSFCLFLLFMGFSRQECWSGLPFPSPKIPELKNILSWVGIWPLLQEGGASGKEPACPCRRHKRCRFNPWVGKIP